MDVDSAWLCQMNIERFHSRLSQEDGGGCDRDMLMRLLASEKEKLDRLAPPENSAGANR
ncbi:hypothetical protein ACN2C6_14245 [Caulobacter sp. ErkDOM-YI]|uniref:hypothetical protein n=1 Tax=unclassified Caulobacter TaxID=2648921 RepID=UPI003AF8A695